MFADGNRVYVGNFDSEGLNVNNYWDDNRNSNLGVASARQSHFYSKMPLCEAFCLLFDLFDPSTEHTTNLIDRVLKTIISLNINNLCVFGEPDHDS